MFTDLINAISSFMLDLWYLWIFLMMVLESSFFPFPSEVAMIPAGYWVWKWVMNFWLVFIVWTAWIFKMDFNKFLIFTFIWAWIWNIILITIWLIIWWTIWDVSDVAKILDRPDVADYLTKFTYWWLSFVIIIILTYFFVKKKRKK